jgi:alanine-synthesizing transaminase
MEFRRVGGLPPYVFAAINELKMQARRAGADVIDLGFGNPDIPSPDVAVNKLVEAARDPRNHRYSASRGIPKLRQAISDLYLRRFGVELDHDREVVMTMGAKEGLSHLMWTLCGPGDTALVPSPSYPIHLYAPVFAGAAVQTIQLEALGSSSPADAGAAVYDQVVATFEASEPRPRVIILSFPHNPTTTCIDLPTMARLVEFARQHEVVLVHDFAYSDTFFDGYRPPSVLEVPGAKDVAVELYTMTKSFSMAGWRVAFLVGNAEIVQALTKLKTYLDYGTFQPIQIAAIVAMNEAPEYPNQVNEIYRSRRDALCDGLGRIGWEVKRPLGTMFVWAPIPEPYREMGSVEFARFLVSEGNVATSPGVGFGEGGDGYVRFALIENEQRIAQGVRGLRRCLTKL